MLIVVTDSAVRWHGVGSVGVSDCSILHVCGVLFLQLPAQRPQIILRSLSDKLATTSNSESLTLFKNSRILCVRSGVVTGVCLGGSDI